MERAEAVHACPVLGRYVAYMPRCVPFDRPAVAQSHCSPNAYFLCLLGRWFVGEMAAIEPAFSSLPHLVEDYLLSKDTRFARSPPQV